MRIFSCTAKKVNEVLFLLVGTRSTRELDMQKF